MQAEPRILHGVRLLLPLLLLSLIKKLSLSAEGTAVVVESTDEDESLEVFHSAVDGGDALLRKGTKKG